MGFFKPILAHDLVMQSILLYIILYKSKKIKYAKLRLSNYTRNTKYTYLDCKLNITVYITIIILKLATKIILFSETILEQTWK